MKKILLTCIAALGFIAGGAQASSDGVAWDKAPNQTNDLAALQNGAKLFVNYCLNCHSASYMRYNRLKDIGLSEQEIKDNLLFTSEKVGDTMKANIDARQAKEWFGGTPPDLTLIARSRADGAKGSGADYLYTYMRTFYPDESKPTGWNNLAFPNIGMPHVLWELQGKREPNYKMVEAHGHETHVFDGTWKQITPGKMSPAEYDQAVGNLVSYLQWMGEPAQGKRVQVGVWVLLFLGLLSLFTWRLNAAFWKDIK